MTVWFIEPHDPLIARDGRPFSSNPGAQANSLPFPFPSTTTGGVRTRAGLNSQGIFDTNKITDIKKIKVRGPLLAQLGPNSHSLEYWLVPAPQDALLFDGNEKGQANCRRLVPLKQPEGAYTDLDISNTENKSKPLLVGLPLPESDPRKPAKNAPSFWYWHSFKNWLLQPDQFEEKSFSVAELGHNGPQRERRIHVSIDGETFVGKEGALFGTSGLEFTHQERPNHLSEARKLALVVAVDGPEADTMREGIAGLGGERRMVSWRKSDDDLPPCPDGLQEAIIKDKACRVILLTPAYFTKGYQPSWFLGKRHEVLPQLKAIATQRPQVVSGWDFERPGPKPSRRLAPSGTVLFLSLAGSDDAIRDWIGNTWMQCISDNDLDRNDGFGLAVLGTWSGTPKEMQ